LVDPGRARAIRRPGRHRSQARRRCVAGVVAWLPRAAISARPCCTRTGRSTTQCCTASPIARHSTRGSTRQAGGGSPPRPNHFRSPDYESPRITGLETWFMLPHERRVGLNHLALDVVGVEALHSWETTLDASNVVRSPIVESPFGWHLNVRAPDNIAVELLAMKPEASAALCG